MLPLRFRPRSPLVGLPLVGALAWLALASGCRIAPLGTVPDPLPETVAWARSERLVGGAFLGLEGRENDSGSLESLSFDPGLRVTAVADGSPAQAAGLALGDVLLRWDDIAVDDPETLAVLLAAASGAEWPELLVQRGDSVFRVPVELRERAAGAGEEPTLAWRVDPARSRAGWLSARGGVALVTSVPDGPFPAAGIVVGSVVTSLDGVPVLSARALIRALQAREPGEQVSVGFVAPSESAERRAQVRLFEPPRRVTEATLPVLAGFRRSADGESASAYLLDLYFISLFRYRRDGHEREFRVLRFLQFSSGVGELTEGTR